jgi:hypothetical protein
MSNRKLVNLDVIETSGVDRGAHLHDGFLVMKNANDTDRVKTLLKEALGKFKESNLSSIQEQIDTAVAKATGEYEQQVTDLESALEAAKNQATDLASKLEAIQSMQSGEEATEVEMGDMAEVPDEIAKSLSGLPADQRESLVKAFKAQSEATAKAVAEIQKEKDIRLDGEAIMKSKDAFKHIGIDHNVVAPALRRLMDVSPDLAKTVESVLLASEAQISESGLLKEFGTSSTNTTSVSVLDEAKTLAKSLVESGVVKTIEQGIEQVLDRNPDLAKRYTMEVNR